ncbi:hypothetical protein CCR87_11265 [Rhodobaculum claviforme]|uniref:DUF4114 domain-containing protein n=1 Tax=Rhodobaculum claviforme TaxID=1549854 RepID=A0A934TMI2_9RHOB|nr:hypothetical protein [Rhodobaculum claviforme]
MEGGDTPGPAGPPPPSVVVPDPEAALAWDALPGLDEAPVAPDAGAVPSAVPVAAVPVAGALAPDAPVVHAAITVDLAPPRGEEVQVGPLATWQRAEAPPVPVIAAPDAAPGAVLPVVPPVPSPPSAPPDPVAVAPLDLPPAPVPIAVRPTLRATGGAIVYNSVGELVNPPDETQMWDYLDPFGGERRGLTPEYINGTTRINTLTLENDHPVSVTFVGEGAGHRNTLGYYRIGPDGTIEDVGIIWANASGARKADVLSAWREAGADAAALSDINRAYARINEGGDLIAGLSTVTLDTLGAGDSFGFFLVANGFNNSALQAALRSDAALSFRTATGDPAVIAPGMSEAPRLHFDYVDAAGRPRSGMVAHDIFHTAANGDTLGLNTSGRQQVISGVIGEDTGALGAWGVRTGDLLIGFEDLPRPGGDSDFNDIVFRLDVGPAFVESLETVSTMPVVTAGVGPGGAPITRATVVFEALGGVGIRLAGEELEPPGGTVRIDGHAIDYSLDVALSGDAATLVLSAPQGVPPDVASRLLSAIELVPADPDARTIPGGDRTLRFQLGTDTADSDIVEAVVRVAHAPPVPVVAPPSVVIPQGPSNADILRHNADAHRAWTDETGRIEAANAALAAAEAEVRAAHAAATEAHAVLADALGALDPLAGAAEEAIARATAAADAMAGADAHRAATHAAALEARSALIEAAAAEDAAAAAVLAAQAGMDAAHAAAVASATGVDALGAHAAAALGVAEAAVAELALRQAAATAAAAQANALLQDVKAADAQVQAAAQVAQAAHGDAGAATAALAACQAWVQDLAATAAADHARLISVHAEASAAHALLEEQRSTLGALEAQRQGAHAAWRAAPDDPAAQDGFELAQAALDAAEAAHLEALAGWTPLSEALAVATAQLATSQAALEAARPVVAQAAQAQASAAGAAARAVADLAAAQDQQGAAAAAHAGALVAFATAEAAAQAAGSVAQDAAAALSEAVTAQALALDVHASGPQVVLAQAEAEFAAAVAAHDAAAAARDAAAADLGDAVARDAQAEAEAAAATATALALLDAAEAAVSALGAAIDATAPAQLAFAAALDDLSASQDARDAVARAGPATAAPGFLDIDHGPAGDAPEGAAALFDFAAFGADVAPPPEGAEGAMPGAFDPATPPPPEDPGYDSLV